MFHCSFLVSVVVCFSNNI